jgi:hypothetical protein
VLFRSLETIGQKAGVAKTKLRRLVLKELVDNALDAGANVSVGINPNNGAYVIQDDGPGIGGTPEEIARLFSINRPLVSSKLWRLPQRGALGNGLRVVVGAVAASDGWIRLWTRNQSLVLTPQDDGTTAVVATEADFPHGTKIEISLGPQLPDDPRARMWATGAIEMAAGGDTYDGRPSPFWFDRDAWFEILQASGPRLVRDFISNLDGCTGGRAGEIAGRFKGRSCASLDRAEAASLLKMATLLARPVRPERLGSVGQLEHLPAAYGLARETVYVGSQEPKAEIPVVAEAWVEFSLLSDVPKAQLSVFVNRTPITGELRAFIDKDGLNIYGCGLSHDVKIGRGTSVRCVINITAPYVPLVTDGKEPDLEPFVDAFFDALEKAIRCAKRSLATNKVKGISQKSIILENLDDAVAKASGDGKYRFGQRQVFYVVRPKLIEAGFTNPQQDTFNAVITEYEAENGEIAGICRDPRGTFYHPHIGESIPLGTLAVEAYKRPKWLFNKVAYIEKEGGFESLKEAKWPERHDCGLLSSKGFTTRAAKDLLDIIGDGGEPVKIFAVHDADASGPMIFQTLQEATAARPWRRKVEIINLGLEPWEAVAMGLPIEAVHYKQRPPIADYIKEEEWREWLLTKRIELNAMTTPEFIAWLDRKMAEHDEGKVLPPDEIIKARIRERLQKTVRDRIVAQILRKSGAEARVAKAIGRIKLPEIDSDDLVDWYEEHEASHWSKWAEEIADDLAAKSEAKRGGRS